MENIHPHKALHFSYASRGTENLLGTVRLVCKSYICKIIRPKCSENAASSRVKGEFHPHSTQSTREEQ